MARKVNKLNFFQKIQSDFENKQSYLSLVLGIFIVVIVGYLLLSYFNKPFGDLLPGRQVDTTEGAQLPPDEDVAKENLPGKYTVKAGDTLFLIAQNYYGDGYKYTLIVDANKLPSENLIEVGQVLIIPKLEQTAFDGNLPPPGNDKEEEIETGGTQDQTTWGEAINGATYTVGVDDWLSKIAGRAYGDIYAFDKIAKANNITDPNLIEAGTVLKIPR